MAIPNLEEVLKTLAAEGVRYILVGGVAAIGHGMNYNTDDIDICYQRTPANYDALVRAFSPIQPQLRIPQGVVPFLFDTLTLKNGLNFTLETNVGPIDLLGEITGVGGYTDLLPHCVEMEFYGIKVAAISLDDLIKAKKAAGRTKDKLHLLELEAIRDILKKS